MTYALGFACLAILLANLCLIKPVPWVITIRSIIALAVIAVALVGLAGAWL